MENYSNDENPKGDSHWMQQKGNNAAMDPSVSCVPQGPRFSRAVMIRPSAQTPTSPKVYMMMRITLRLTLNLEQRVTESSIKLIDQKYTNQDTISSQFTKKPIR